MAAQGLPLAIRGPSRITRECDEITVRTVPDEAPTSGAGPPGGNLTVAFDRVKCLPGFNRAAWRIPRCRSTPFVSSARWRC